MNPPGSQCGVSGHRRVTRRAHPMEFRSCSRTQHLARPFDVPPPRAGRGQQPPTSTRSKGGFGQERRDPRWGRPSSSAVYGLGPVRHLPADPRVLSPIRFKRARRREIKPCGRARLERTCARPTRKLNEWDGSRCHSRADVRNGPPVSRPDLERVMLTNHFIPSDRGRRTHRPARCDRKRNSTPSKGGQPSAGGRLPSASGLQLRGGALIGGPFGIAFAVGRGFLATLLRFDTVFSAPPRHPNAVAVRISSDIRARRRRNQDG